MNYYDVLGVTRNASEKDIKNAFRKLAAKHHPDKGGDHKKFTELNEAYQTLTDPKKKQMYDQFGTADPQQAGFQQQGFSGFGGFEDIFSDLFAHGGADEEVIFGPGGIHRRSRRVPKNHNLRIDLQISLEQAYNGHKATITIPTGGGRGTRTIDVDVPRGINDGQTVRLRGLGDDSIKGVPPGDLHMFIRIGDYRGFKRDGFDLYYDLTISVFDLILGCKASVEHINGHTYQLNVPAGTQPETLLSMKGLGMPYLNASNTGTLYVKIKGQVPKDLTSEQLELITKMRGK